MKILVLGAGAIGGYFGGRLAQAGADIAFLVRENRAARLRQNGLVVRSPHGDFKQEIRLLLASQLGESFDLVLLACKAYDLDSAIESIRPAVGPDTHVLPLLNGIAHIEKLQKTFGVERVLGGSCAIPVTMTPTGEIVHLLPLHRIVFGLLPESGRPAEGKLKQLLALFRTTPVDAALAADTWLELWEKFVSLTTLAASTCLMRAAVGDILASDEGAAYLQQTFDACARAAEAAGHPPREEVRTAYGHMLQQRASTLTASMLRDIEAGSRTEGEHIVADMLRRVQALGIDPGALRPAWMHLQSYEQRRARELDAKAASA
ncbi:MAG: 2-dehydropantoate 2-reductase [Ramlibacter sp.]|nr:2-dehydropantoate 2-reductase [Ramlibacter sp.]